MCSNVAVAMTHIFYNKVQTYRSHRFCTCSKERACGARRLTAPRTWYTQYEVRCSSCFSALTSSLRASSHRSIVGTGRTTCARGMSCAGGAISASVTIAGGTVCGSNGTIAGGGKRAAQSHLVGSSLRLYKFLWCAYRQ